MTTEPTVEPQKREKTSGEKVFNGLTYGGVALLGNEGASLVIMGEAGKEVLTKTPGIEPRFWKEESAHWFAKSYQNFAKFCTTQTENASSSFKKFIPTYFKGADNFSDIEKAMVKAKAFAKAEARLKDVALPEAEKLLQKESIIKNLIESSHPSPRLPTLLYATIGGMLMVLPVKLLEDNKGPLVRTFDRWIHGKKAEHDPAMIEAHKEMEEAPHQTWTSLAKGRVITVLAALFGDAIFGWRHSLSAKVLENVPVLKNVRSLDHIADEVAMAVTKKFGKETELEKIVGSKLFETTHNATWLLTLSSTLTALFYVTSKLMAKKEATTDGVQHTAKAPHAPFLDEVNVNDAAQLDQSEQADKPASRVSQVAHFEPLQAQTAQQLG